MNHGADALASDFFNSLLKPYQHEYGYSRLDLRGISSRPCVRRIVDGEADPLHLKTLSNISRVLPFRTPSLGCLTRPAPECPGERTGFRIAEGGCDLGQRHFG